MSVATQFTATSRSDLGSRQKRATDRKLQRPSLAQLPLFTRYAVTAFLAAKKIVSSSHTSGACMMEFEIKNFSRDCRFLPRALWLVLFYYFYSSLLWL